jgi:hypothetical protein
MNEKGPFLGQLSMKYDDPSQNCLKVCSVSPSYHFGIPNILGKAAENNRAAQHFLLGEDLLISQNKFKDFFSKDCPQSHICLHQQLTNSAELTINTSVF